MVSFSTDNHIVMTSYRFTEELKILQEAKLAAKVEASRIFQESPDSWYPCGFVWVKIRPARGRFVSMCREQKIGATDTLEGGFIIYNPSGITTQWLVPKKNGAEAFVKVIKKYYPEMDIQIFSRVD